MTPLQGWLRRSAAFALGLSAACLSAPPYAEVTPVGIVRASSREAAEETVALLSGLAPAVSSKLPGARDPRLEVWVQDRWRSGLPSLTGYTELFDGGRARIHVNAAGRELPTTLAHELVHALMDESWDALPGVLEEGLCTLIAEEVAPPTDPMFAVSRILHLGSYFDQLPLRLEHVDPGAEGGVRRLTLRISFEGDEEHPVDLEEALSIPGRGALSGALEGYTPTETAELHAVGYLLAARLVEKGGVDSIKTLCARARAQGCGTIPAAWLREEAELTEDDDWLAAAWSLMRPEDLQLLAVSQPGLFVVPLVAVVEGRVKSVAAGSDLDGLLDLTRPTLQFARGRMPLTDVPGVKEMLEARWR